MTHYTENCSPNIAVTPDGLFDFLVHTIRQWLQVQKFKAGIQRERAALLEMSEAMLKDIGVDRDLAVQEARRSDIPAARRLS